MSSCRSDKHPSVVVYSIFHCHEITAVIMQSDVVLVMVLTEQMSTVLDLIYTPFISHTFDETLQINEAASVSCVSKISLTVLFLMTCTLSSVYNQVFFCLTVHIFVVYNY